VISLALGEQRCYVRQNSFFAFRHAILVAPHCNAVIDGHRYCCCDDEDVVHSRRASRQSQHLRCGECLSGVVLLTHGVCQSAMFFGAFQIVVSLYAVVVMLAMWDRP